MKIAAKSANSNGYPPGQIYVFRMGWSEIGCRKHEGRTLPEVAFHDPDYLFWAVEKGEFFGQLALEAEEISKKATTILVPDRYGESVCVEYHFDFLGHFKRMEVVRRNQSFQSRCKGVIRSQFIDLSIARRYHDYQKGASASLVRAAKEILFEDGSYRITRKRAQRFFDNPKNFQFKQTIIYPVGWSGKAS